MNWLSSKLIQWLDEARWHKSVSHCFEGLLIYIPTAILGYFIWNITGIFLGAICVATWYWSREKVQQEYKLKGDGNTNTVWARGWFPFQWDLWSQLDLYLPVLSSVLLTIILYYLKAKL
jgi:hypothetical protein